MRKELVKTPEQALLYITDCCLATVCDMACKKSKSKSEFERQIAIAQSAVDWLKEFGVEVGKHERAYEVLALPGQKVEVWANSFK